VHFIKARIRQLRAKGKTQTGLAQAIDVDPARITEIMKGERQVKVSELKAMARYLEMSLPKLVDALVDVEAGGGR
jgi:transcriptional regulator with XRE-family HTH domain